MYVFMLQFQHKFHGRIHVGLHKIHARIRIGLPKVNGWFRIGPLQIFHQTALTRFPQSGNSCVP